MGILAMLLGTMNVWLPQLINTAEVLRGSAPGSGPTKLQDVLQLANTGAQMAGIVDPAHQAIINGLATASINSIVAVNNAVKAGTVPAATAQSAGVFVPAIANAVPAAPATPVAS